jgi:nicotinate (nicotinamide) nucleotide adenylyltransferase/ribosome silencing factor RsfS/YbeB/iojap
MLLGVQGILGGTFDPPHNAHIEMARAAYTQLGLDAVRLMPAGDPWQKHDVGVSDAAHRLEMVKLLAAADPYLVVDKTEVLRGGSTYTIDTIEKLEERSVLILGSDAALGMPTWHRAGEISEFVDIAVAPRPGVVRADVEAAVGGPVVWLDMDPVNLSSTMIRLLARSRGDYSDLVPDSIARYIAAEGLYQPRENRHGDSLSSAVMTNRANTATPDAIAAARTAAAALDDKAGEDIAILDLSDLLVVTDIFVLVTGTSRRNVLTLADETAAALRELDRRPIRKEGTDHGKWVLLDYGDVVIHVFDRETREYYDLERLWAGAPRIEFEPTSSTTEA